MNTTPGAGPVPASALKAFEMLVRQHHRRLLAYAASLARRPEVAEDLVQEAFVTAWRRMEEYDTSRDFGAWLRGIIRMKHLESARRRREEPLDGSILDSLDMTHEGWGRAAEERGADVFAALRDCLRRLEDAPRKAVGLFYMSQLSCLAVAQATGATEDTVRKRLQRARESLARCLRAKLGTGVLREGEA